MPPPPALLHELFQAQAARTPDSVALREADTSISYGRLAARSNALSQRLRRAGVAAGSNVGLHLERSIDYVAALLAVLQAGAAAVPLPPSYPEARRREILGFAGLEAVIDHPDTLVGALAGPPAARVTVSDGELEEEDPPPTPSASAPRLDRPAFVLCSSGSTGKPKMIVRSHGSFFHRLGWTWREHPFSPGEECCQKSFMTTTHAIYELFEPLLSGVPVTIVPDQEVRDIAGFFATVRKRRVTRLLVVPSLLQAALELEAFVPPPLKVLVLMGEHVPARLAARAVAAFPRDTKIFSIYGSTEASSTVVCDLRASTRPGEELPLGRPISPDIRLHVLDHERRPVARGEVGRLHVGGPALFDGYFRDPELTASVLAAAEDGEPLYDTKDQVRVLPDGELRFVGRIDDTVKVRGFRVDLAEVERAILQHPGVRQAAVVARANEEGTSTILGFYTPASAEPATVFAALRERLPAYMIPSALSGLDAFPLTANGKIDRRTLAGLRATAPAASSRALTATEEDVLAVWTSVVGHGAIGLESRFFEVGGTSLSVFTALRRLRDRFSLGAAALSEQALYAHPTLEGLSSHIDALRNGRAPSASARSGILVTLKKAAQKDLEPLFLISPAGGTLGAYQRLVDALRTKREVIGVRDPFVWGERDPTKGFQRWAAIYTEAIQERQPRGPYFVGAYSSGAVFGYEVAQGLRRAGERVELLALIDPLGVDRRDKRRWGYWIYAARVDRPILKPLVALLARLRRLVPRPGRVALAPPPENDETLTREEFETVAERARTSRSHILGLSVLLELNTGQPFALRRSDLDGVPPSRYLGRFLDKAASVSEDIDPASLERIVVQYYLQTQAQHRYRLQPYGGKLVLFEPAGPHRGLFAAQFGPLVEDLRTVSLPVEARGDHARLLSEAFQKSIRVHYGSMRDDAFARGLAAELDRLL